MLVSIVEVREPCDEASFQVANPKESLEFLAVVGIRNTTWPSPMKPWNSLNLANRLLPANGRLLEFCKHSMSGSWWVSRKRTYPTFHNSTQNFWYFGSSSSKRSARWHEHTKPSNSKHLWAFQYKLYWKRGNKVYTAKIINSTKNFLNKIKSFRHTMHKAADMQFSLKKFLYYHSIIHYWT